MSKNLVINVVTAKAMLDNVVERFGADHIAETVEYACVYFRVEGHRIIASCIVGQVLSDLGILRATMGQGGESGDVCSVDSTIWREAERYGVTVTEQAQMLFRGAQSRQDSKTPWGEAVQGAWDEAMADERNRIEVAVDKYQRQMRADSEFPMTFDALADWERDLLKGQDEDQPPF